MPQTPVKKPSHQRGIPDLAWFFQDGYPTPNEKHVRNGGLAKEGIDDGTSIDLWDGSTPSEEESDTELVPEDKVFVVQDDELLHADDKYASKTSSSVDEHSSESEEDLSELQGSRKRAYSSSVDNDDEDKSAKRRRLIWNDAEMASELARAKAEDSEKEDRKGGEWTRLLGFAADIVPSDPDLYFASLQLENREPHALTDIEFPPELFAALDQAYAKIRSDDNHNHNNNDDDDDDGSTTETEINDSAKNSPNSTAAAINPKDKHPLPSPHRRKTPDKKKKHRPHRRYIPTEHNNRAPPHHRALRPTAAGDLELANEIALARFRDLCHAHLPRVAHEHYGVFGPGPRDGWVRARDEDRDGDGDGDNKFTWWVGGGDGDGDGDGEGEEQEGCVELGAALPGTEWRVRVRVVGGWEEEDEEEEE
ncbi:hypothetical protein F4775DRAFT_591170 [Biscogniauxia sp. FL1348]|nr:hypothetical protein F4775DRAFT_591170 [Biscogniauxia sp. FL1348]